MRTESRAAARTKNSAGVSARMQAEFNKLTEGMGNLERRAILSIEEVCERIYYVDFEEKKATALDAENGRWRWCWAPTA